MAEGSLAANGTATVTLDDRVVQVIVTAVGGELWVTTDGSNPDASKPGTARVIPARSPQAIPVTSDADPSVVRLRSPDGADYEVTAGPLTDADSAEGMGAGPAESGATDVEVAAAVAAHVDDTTAAHAASAVSFAPSGLIVATNVQAAIAELDAEKAVIGHAHSGAYEPIAGHWTSTGTAPTIAVGAGAGSGATASITGTDTVGIITLNVGSGPATGLLFTVTFAATYGGSGPQAVILMPANTAAVQDLPYTGRTATTITASATAVPAASTSHFWFYIVVG